MKAYSKVIQNSLWMGIQPIILNIISIFVIGYIASRLGKADYGVFVFAFSLVVLFTPITELGLRAVTVREIASDRSRADIVVGKILVLRLFLACLTYLLMIFVVNVLKYPNSTKLIVYLAGINLFTTAMARTLFDTFQAFEKMKYIAYTNFISGAILTLFSVIVIYAGYGLIAVTLVYVGGSALAAIIIGLYYRIHFPGFKPAVDRAFYRDALRQGFPFFLSAMLWIANHRINFVLLSKLTDDEAVGVYGASFTILEKLWIVPDSIGTAIFPTIAYLYARKQHTELGKLVGQFFHYLLILGLAFSLGLALLASRAIDLIYGTKFADASVILSIFSLGIPFHFANGLFAFALGAVHRQGYTVRAVAVAVTFNLVVTLLLIPHLAEVGAAVGYAISLFIQSIFLVYFFYRFQAFPVKKAAIMKTLIANAVMCAAILFAKNINLLTAIALPGLLYLCLIVVLRVVSVDDLKLIKDAVFSREKKIITAEQLGDIET